MQFKRFVDNWYEFSINKEISFQDVKSFTYTKVSEARNIDFDDTEFPDIIPVENYQVISTSGSTYIGVKDTLIDEGVYSLKLVLECGDVYWHKELPAFGKVPMFNSLC